MGRVAFSEIIINTMYIASMIDISSKFILTICMLETPERVL